MVCTIYNERRGDGRRQWCGNGRRAAEPNSENWHGTLKRLRLLQSRRDGRAATARQLDAPFAAKNFQSGMQTLRLEFSLFDYSFTQTPAPDYEGFLATLNAHADIAIIDTLIITALPMALAISSQAAMRRLLFYKWAELLSADASVSLKKVFNPALAKRFAIPYCQ